jgi:hypothetical protein
MFEMVLTFSPMASGGGMDCKLRGDAHIAACALHAGHQARKALKNSFAHVESGAMRR